MALKAFAWALVPAVGLVELAAHFYFSTRPPRAETWKRVRPVVEELRKKDELVVVAPYWAEPNARSAFGDALMPVRDVARPDATAWPRAIEVSIIGKSAPELADWQIVGERSQDGFRFRTLVNPKPAHVAYDFVDHVADATVVTVRGNGEQPCTWRDHARRSAGGLHGNPAFPEARHECAGGEGSFVGVTVVEDEQWHGRRCIWAEPSPGAARVLRFHDVPLGKVVRGYATLPWWVERELRGGPVSMEVFVAGASIGKYTHQDGDGWKPFEFPLGAAAAGRVDVEFRVTGARGRDRQFCFQADTR